MTTEVGKRGGLRCPGTRPHVTIPWHGYFAELLQWYKVRCPAPGHISCSDRRASLVTAHEYWQSSLHDHETTQAPYRDVYHADKHDITAALILTGRLAAAGPSAGDYDRLEEGRVAAAQNRTRRPRGDAVIV